MTYKINSFFTRLLIAITTLLGVIGISPAKASEVTENKYNAAITPVTTLLLSDDPYSY